MKFYGWRQGDWKGEDNGPSSQHAKLKSRDRQQSRRHAKKRTRQASKKNVACGCLTLTNRIICVAQHTKE